MNRRGEGDGVVVASVLFCGVVLLGLIVLGMWGCPKYAVYEQNLKGEAELARAQQNRQIAIAQSRAKAEAATFEAAAETTRARGVAIANQIIGQSLKNNESYLHYLWIHTLNDSTKQVIYVPTEAGLPILEAGKRRP